MAVGALSGSGKRNGRRGGGGVLALMLKEEVGRGSRTSCTALGRVAQQRRRQGDSSMAIGPAR
jgi:hypothetical protein